MHALSAPLQATGAVYPLWLGALGPAFRGLKCLDMHSSVSGNVRTKLESVFWSSLSFCPALTQLDLRMGSWALGQAVCSFPQLLRLWLPQLRELQFCERGDYGLLPLVSGLAPQLTRLVASGTSGDYQYAPSLSACRKLQQLEVGTMDQALLDVLVTLPSLKTVTVGQLGALQQPRPSSQSEWQELRLLRAAPIPRLAKLPLATTQRLVLGTGYPGLAVPRSIAAQASMRDAVAALAAVPDLQVPSEIPLFLLLRPWGLPSARVEGDSWEEEEEAAAQQQQAQQQQPQSVAAADQLQAALLDSQAALSQLHTAIAAFVPLGHRCRDCFIFSNTIHRVCASIGSATVAAIGHAFPGLCSMFLSIGPTGAPCTLAPSLWFSLPQHLPSLAQLFIDIYQPLEPQSYEAMQHLTATHTRDINIVFLLDTKGKPAGHMQELRTQVLDLSRETAGRPVRVLLSGDD